MAEEKQLSEQEQEPGRYAVRCLAKAIGELIEANQHEGGGRAARLASAELHLQQAFEVIEPGLEAELAHEPTGDVDDPDKKPAGDVEAED